MIIIGLRRCVGDTVLLHLAFAPSGGCVLLGFLRLLDIHELYFFQWLVDCALVDHSDFPAFEIEQPLVNYVLLIDVLREFKLLFLLGRLLELSELLNEVNTLGVSPSMNL